MGGSHQAEAEGAGRRRALRPRVSKAALEDVSAALRGIDPGRALRRLALRSAAVAGTLSPDRPDVAAEDTAKRRLTREAALESVLADLVSQGWQVEVEPGAEPMTVVLNAPAATARAGETPDLVKERVRRSLEAMRAEAMSEPPTREFVRRMETRQPFGARRVSVLDLVDDGATLADQLRLCAATAPEGAAAALAAVVDPVVEVVIPGARCATTGLDLTDIWRYFRLTWALPYRSTPGRTFAFLVRNAARPGRPVMGIGALASPVAQLSRRDDWIGWTVAGLKRRLAADPSEWPAQRDALLRTLAEVLYETRIDDLILEAGSTEGLRLEDALLAISRRAAAERIAALQPLRERLDQGESDLSAVTGAERQSAGSDVGRGLPLLQDDRVDWRKASEDVLFVRKRAKVAADILGARRILARATRDGAEARALLENDEVFLRAVSVGLREVRKVGLASRVLDLSVCGAVAPYGALIAGKLVALVVGSVELRAAYRSRYAEQASVIASQMAGREIRRTSDYCALATTSLYGVASSQYNRLALNVEGAAGVRELKWTDLDVSVGYGTVHLSKATLEALTEATRAQHGGRNVNYRFGEGHSASLRQAREGLQLVVDDPNAVLNHEASRRVYGLAIGPGALAALRRNEPYLAAAAAVGEIGAAWRCRWLQRRIGSEDVLEAVAAQGPLTVQDRLVVDDGEPDHQIGLFSGARGAR